MFGKAILFAAFDMGQLLPLIIGGAFAVGIAIVGLFMLRNKSANTAQAQQKPEFETVDASAPRDTVQPQLQPPAAAIQGRNPLWGVVLPGLGALLIGGAIFWVVIPFVQDFFTARDNFESQLKTNFTTMTKPKAPIQMPTEPVQIPQFQMQPIQPQIQTPVFKPVFIPPPPPRIPQVPVIRVR
jgi:hypothetical protein